MLDCFPKVHQTFKFKLFSTLGETEKGTDIINRISHFWDAITNAPHIYRRPAKFLTFFRHYILYHFILCQVNTAKHAVNWLTQMLWFQTAPISIATLKFNHSEFRCGIVSLQFILSQHNFLPDNSTLLQATKRTVIWWIQCA